MPASIKILQISWWPWPAAKCSAPYPHFGSTAESEAPASTSRLTISASPLFAAGKSCEVSAVSVLTSSSSTGGSSSATGGAGGSSSTSSGAGEGLSSGALGGALAFG